MHCIKYGRLTETAIGRFIKDSDEYGFRNLPLHARSLLRSLGEVKLNMEPNESNEEYVKFRDTVLSEVNVVSNTLNEETNRRTIVVKVWSNLHFIFEDEGTNTEDIIVAFMVYSQYREKLFGLRDLLNDCDVKLLPTIMVMITSLIERKAREKVRKEIEDEVNN